MLKQKIYPLTLVFLGICILCGSLYIGIQLDRLRQEISEPRGGLLTLEEAAIYLSITTDELDDILRDDQIEKGKLNIYDTYRFIPFIEINEEYRFDEEQLDAYINYRMMNSN